MMKKIMVCHDGSEKSNSTLDKALELFEASKPDIIIITVVEPPLDATSVDEESFEKWRAKRDEDLGNAACRAAEHGLEVDAILAVGDPRMMIIRASEEKSPDVLVISRREAGMLGTMVFGKVSAYIIKHANCPVAVL